MDGGKVRVDRLKQFGEANNHRDAAGVVDGSDQGKYDHSLAGSEWRGESPRIEHERGVLRVVVDDRHSLFALHKLHPVKDGGL